MRVTRSPGTGVTTRDWVVGVLAAVAVLARVTVGPRVPLSGADQLVTTAMAVVTGAALVWRRRRPMTATAVSVAASTVLSLVAGPVIPMAGWLAVLVAARYVVSVPAALRAAVGAGGAVLVATTVSAVLHDRPQPLTPVLALTVIVVLAAVLLRVQAARVQAQRQARDADRRQAAVAERLRIARDLHDLVGHGLSTVAVQSSTARLALDAGDPAGARRALAGVEAASRAALAEMRQLLGVLRLGDPADPADPSASVPTPGLAGIDDLAADARAAGHRVRVERAGPLDAVPAATALSAYRVAQEAITNAMRHAPGAALTVYLRAGPDLLLVEVLDDGSDDSGAAAADPDRPRYGLLGLRERVSAAGGTVDAGLRTDAAGWRVAARLPLDGGVSP